MQMPRFIMVTLCLIFPSWGQAQTPPPTGAGAQQGATQNQGVKPVPIPGQNQVGNAQTATQGTPATGQGQIGSHSQGGTPAQNIGPGQAGQPGLNIGPGQGGRPGLNIGPGQAGQPGLNIGPGQGGSTKTNTVPAQTAPSSFASPLVRWDNAPQSLNLTTDQLNRLNQMTIQMQNRYRSNLPLTSDNQAAALETLRMRYQNDWQTGAGQILSEQQINRYRQLDLQYRNFSSLTDPVLVKRLNLSDSQLQQVRQAQDWSKQQMQILSQLNMSNPNERSIRYRTYWSQGRERLDQILTLEQRRIWVELTGEPFVFDPPVPTENGPGK